MIASERIDDIARFTGAFSPRGRREELTPHSAAGTNVVWRPVLLGGLYDLTNAPQGKDGSAMDVPMPDSKKKLLSADFQREIRRYALPLKFHPQHPLKSVDGKPLAASFRATHLRTRLTFFAAGRLLCAFPDAHRPRLAHALFRAYCTLFSGPD